MALRTIRTQGDEVLEKVCRPIAEVTPRIRTLAEQFQQEHGTLVCRELLKSLPGKLKQDPQPRTEAYYKVRPCVRFVETAAKLLEELLEV